MHKYERLEKYYYRKKFFKVFLIIFAILAIVGAGLFLFIKNKHKNIKKINQQVDNLKLKKTNKTKEKTKEKNKNKIKKTKMKVSENPVSENSKSKAKLSFILPTIKVEKVAEHKKVKIQKKEIKQTKKIIKPKKNLIKVEKKIDIEDLINSFNQNPSYDIAIRISNYYLNRNNLALSKTWALKANNINPSKADSWKIFAIILIKQKKFTKAKEVLKIYLNDYGENSEITKLLRSLNDK